MTFGERLLDCIEASGISQRKLASIVEATPTQLNYWVKDKRQPDIPYIRKLANALNVSTDYLICNDDFAKNEESTLSEEALEVARAFEDMSEYGKAIIRDVIDQENKYSSVIKRETAKIEKRQMAIDRCLEED